MPIHIHIHIHTRRTKRHKVASPCVINDGATGNGPRCQRESERASERERARERESESESESENENGSESENENGSENGSENESENENENENESESESGYDKKISFDNGYGASVICKPFSYGCDEKLFEVAVTKFGEVCYDTDVTDDVCRQQNFEDVVEVLHMIRNLPPAEKENGDQGSPRWRARSTRCPKQNDGNS